ncbi:DUF1659 domain-containing protein [Ectobacillus antri]|jgi:hypothetical protein|uniref:DUF1659 domain-containing protein n=1 Tax=Ectobacillus antri TaxID=2486280 RepID=A0ABT6H9L2_9BACI|nr:DUF1659 domain-containing protein [Ectobacillus antri]MDG4658569.1 DUF1659 domain-containing protein [Ectobacillus antri]MDG5755573.1 DUF1659 domain-containing protein [Ectobacillus antri]
MAIQSGITDMNLRLTLNGGTDANGKAIMKNKVYRFVKVDAPAEKVHEVALALASLQQHTLEAIQLVSTSDIVSI